jgi:hypothetical protein
MARVIKHICFRVAVLVSIAGGLPAASHAGVVVSAAATANMACSDGVCAPTAQNAVLNISDLENLLAGGDVEITTTGSGVQAGAITVDAPLTWPSDSALALDAYQTVSIENLISVSGGGAISLATNEEGAGGSLFFAQKGHITFPSTSNNLVINGLQYSLVATLPELVTAIKANASGNYALSQDYDATGDGKYRIAAITTPFGGNFNGLGNAISHLRINDDVGKKYSGLFGELSTSSNVSSVRLLKLNLDAAQESRAGGIAGLNYGTVYNSSVEGSLSAPRGMLGAYGGAVGTNEGTFANVTSDVTIILGPKTSYQMYAGGLAGANVGTVEESFAEGSITVTGSSESAYIAGLVGLNGGDVKNCYATGAASAENSGGDSLVGGLIAYNALNVTDSYSTGAPSAAGTNNDIGGLIGVDQSEGNGGTITNTYWDMTTSGITNPNQGAGNIPNDPGITGETTAQLQSGLPKGFRKQIWHESQKRNGGLPYLSSKPHH